MLAANSSSPTSVPVLRTLAGEGFSLLSAMSFVALAIVACVHVDLLRTAPTPTHSTLADAEESGGA